VNVDGEGMATARKSKPKARTATKSRAKKKKAPVKRTRAKSTTTRRRVKKPAVPRIDLDQAASKTELEMKGDRLVVRLSRQSHPEIFELDRLTKAVDRVINHCKRKKQTRDVVEFLGETRKGLQILLRNHLEDAMRKYLK
jgi:hypothetical protein